MQAVLAAEEENEVRQLLQQQPSIYELAKVSEDSEEVINLFHERQAWSRCFARWQLLRQNHPDLVHPLFGDLFDFANSCLLTYARNRDLPHYLLTMDQKTLSPSLDSSTCTKWERWRRNEIKRLNTRRSDS
jgi:hypothetical protein